MQKQTELTKVIQANQTSKTAFKVLSQRLRFGKNTDLGKLKREIKQASGNLNQTEFLNLFKHLEKLGYGSIIVGRGGRSSRFAWNYNLGKVLKASGVSLPEAVKESAGVPRATQLAPPKYTPTPKLKASPQGANELKIGIDGIEGVIQTPDQKELISFKVSTKNVSTFLKLLELMGEIRK
jgi:hypothetical protein